MQIDGARILVTGGCGLVGSTTIDLLLHEHRLEKIVILDNQQAHVSLLLAGPGVPATMALAATVISGSIGLSILCISVVHTIVSLARLAPETPPRPIRRLISVLRNDGERQLE